jgi:hypothetical protein
MTRSSPVGNYCDLEGAVLRAPDPLWREYLPGHYTSHVEG